MWEGRYRGHLVADGPPLLACMRYVEQQAAEPEAGWSSLPHHLGQRRDPLLTDPPAYWALGNTPFDREAAYRAWREQGVAATEAADIEAAHTVLVVSKSHLDVGFTDLAGAVRQRWLREHLPRAISTARSLRDSGAEERLCWTTGSWIINEALEEPDRRLRQAVEAAIESGDLAWHALPFTTHTELADRSLLAHGLSISARLDQWFERRTRAAKLTDVPGHTRAIVSLLAAAGATLP